MEPLPESTEAAGELDALVYDDDLLDQLRGSARRVNELVPHCVGMSLTMLEQGVTLTLVATDADVARLDAMQYLDGGPCIESVEQGRVVANDSVLFDERRWQLFGAASAAHGVASTLSLPLLAADESVVGGVNLYAATPHAFDGHHEGLADILGAWAAGAVSNADLSFSSRLRARAAPGVLRDAARLDTAVGLLAAYLRVPEQSARDLIDSAASSTGLPPATIASTLLALLGDRGEDHDTTSAELSP